MNFVLVKQKWIDHNYAYGREAAFLFLGSGWFPMKPRQARFQLPLFIIAWHQYMIFCMRISSDGFGFPGPFNRSVGDCREAISLVLNRFPIPFCIRQFHFHISVRKLLVIDSGQNYALLKLSESWLGPFLSEWSIGFWFLSAKDPKEPQGLIVNQILFSMAKNHWPLTFVSESRY
jgi:hypothetical protein